MITVISIILNENINKQFRSALGDVRLQVRWYSGLLRDELYWKKKKKTAKRGHLSAQGYHEYWSSQCFPSIGHLWWLKYIGPSSCTKHFYNDSDPIKISFYLKRIILWFNNVCSYLVIMVSVHIYHEKYSC
jgi:hypothetical protein